MHSSTTFGRHRRKIEPLQPPSAETLAYARQFEGNSFGPGELAIAEWLALGLELPDLDQIRRYRLARVREQLQRFDCAGILLYDPLNIRYACDSSNMQVWCLHDAARYCFVGTNKPLVLFDYAGTEHLSAHLSLIDEVRPARFWFYMVAGQRYLEFVERWADEIAELVHTSGGSNRRLAVDRCNPAGIRALEARGIEVLNGEEVMELARVIKHEEEIKALRCAVAACESAMQVMYAHLQPGVTEQRLWSYLHAENIARGGEWIETRLLASGPRTNPWFHECSSREIQAGDLVAFDTDLIGPYGYCSDISRTWLCGDGPATAEQKHLYTMAYEQIHYNRELLKPGRTFCEVAAAARSLPPTYFPQRYGLHYHGVGLCDEYPTIRFIEDWETTGYDGVLEENMVLCVESYVGEVGGSQGVKLEDQVVIRRDGAELISTYPFEERLLQD